MKGVKSMKSMKSMKVRMRTLHVLPALHGLNSRFERMQSAKTCGSDAGLAPRFLNSKARRLEERQVRLFRSSSLRAFEFHSPDDRLARRCENRRALAKTPRRKVSAAKRRSHLRMAFRKSTQAAKIFRVSTACLFRDCARKMRLRNRLAARWFSSLRPTCWS